LLLLVTAIHLVGVAAERHPGSGGVICVLYCIISVIDIVNVIGNVLMVYWYDRQRH